MANRYAVKTGNWSDTTVWDGGTLPGAADVVRPNGFTVTIDQDITVTDLTCNASSPAVANGEFTIATIPGGGRILATNIGGAGGGAPNRVLSISAASGTLTVNGNVGSTIAGTVGTPYSIFYTATGSSLIVNGNVFGALTSNGHGIGYSTFAATITVNGNVTAGNLAAGIAITGTATATITVNGNVRGSPSTAFAIQATGASSVITCAGEVVAGMGQVAVLASAATSMVRARGPLRHSVTNKAPLQAESFVIYSSGNTQYVGGSDRTPPTAAADVYLQRWNDQTPPTADVEAGTVYGPTSNLTGTLVIPPAGSVAYGVPVDNATGTAVLTIDSGVATVESTNAQIEAVLG